MNFIQYSLLLLEIKLSNLLNVTMSWLNVSYNAQEQDIERANMTEGMMYPWQSLPNPSGYAPYCVSLA